MSDFTVKRHDMQPDFDLEAFMVMSQETRLGGAVLERVGRFWDENLPNLGVHEIAIGNTSFLAVWLPQSVEEAVDAAWAASPSDGYLLNSLAQFMCMSAVQELLPQVELSGCAPSPRPTERLREALASVGLEYRDGESDLLMRRYAMVTHYPFRGGCEICHLQSHCPKGQGQGENVSVLLPGHEKEEG